MNSRARITRPAVLIVLLLGCVPSAGPAEQLNVLLVVFDDLRVVPTERRIEQPSLERLAERGMTFANAYAQQPSCNPSRASFLTGLRPGTTGVQDNRVFYREMLPDVVTLPQLFRTRGYFTARVGKMFHNPQEWRERKTWRHESTPPGSGLGLRGRGRRVTGGRFAGDRWLAAKGTDTDQPDGAAAIAAVELLEKPRRKPFFIAVGFHKPHSPYRAPSRDFRRYKLASLPTEWDDLPGPDVPAATIPNPSTARLLESLTLRDRRELMRGYHAASTFADRQLGVLLDALDRLDLWRSTAVVVMSDHGYHLGEHGWWGKNTLYEESLKVPLLIYAPRPVVGGKRSERPVELLDLYPTLADLAGLEPPPGLEGRSLRPLMQNPDRPWFPAFSEERRGGSIARTVRDQDWRYTEWGPGADDVELYDLVKDPRQRVNLAGDAAYAEVQARLAQLLD